jgi:hypothetical protein
MKWLARLFERAGAPDDAPEVQTHAADDGSRNVEELSLLLREARSKARAARQRGRVMQRDGRMTESLRAYKQATEFQEKADRLERERSLIRRAG